MKAKLVCEFDGSEDKRDQAYYDEFERKLRLMFGKMVSSFKSRIVMRPHAGVAGHVCWSLACDSDVNHSEDMMWLMIDATAGTVTVFSEGFEPYADVLEADDWWGPRQHALRYVDRDGNGVDVDDEEYDKLMFATRWYYELPYFRVTGRFTLDNMDDWKTGMEAVIYEISDDISTKTGEDEDEYEGEDEDE